MPLKHFGHQGNTPHRRHVRKAHQPRVWNISHIHKLSEVGVDRHQNSAFGRGTFEECLISWVGTKRARFDNVVALATQPIR